MRYLFFCLTLALAAPLQAKPLITNSEETPARLCLAGRDSPDRILALCDVALGADALTATERSELLAAQAEALFDLDRHEDAEASYRRAIEVDGDNVRALNGLGWVLWDLDRHGEAVEIFQTSVDLHVTGNGLSGLASSSYRSGAIPVDEATGMLDAAISIDPEDNWSHREKGWMLRQNGRYDAARAAFEAALDIYADDDNAFYGLGRVQADLGQHEAALESFGRAIALNNHEVGPYVHRAYSLRMLDRNAQALRDAEQVIDMAPDYAGGYVEQALALVGLRQRSKALGIFETARENGISGNYFLYWFADTLSDDGQDERALSVIDEALALEGREAIDYSLKAYIANRLEQFDTALEAAQIATEQDPDMAYAHYHAAVALLGQGATEEGIERFDLAMQKGLPNHMVGEFAGQLISHGKYLAAVALRGKY